MKKKTTLPTISMRLKLCIYMGWNLALSCTGILAFHKKCWQSMKKSGKQNVFEVTRSANGWLVCFMDRHPRSDMSSNALRETTTATAMTLHQTTNADDVTTTTATTALSQIDANLLVLSFPLATITSSYSYYYGCIYKTISLSLKNLSIFSKNCNQTFLTKYFF